MVQNFASRFCRTSALLIWLTAALPHPAGAQTYTITDLGTLPGHTHSFARDINKFGQVVGYSGITSEPYRGRAFLWSAANGMVDLGTLSGHTDSCAFSLNDSGQVVGYSRSLSEFRAFVWSGAGNMTNLGTLPGSSFSLAFAINNQGQVVGKAGTPNAGRAFLWTAGNGMTDIGDPFNTNNVYATDINEQGQVVGRAGNQAFVWSAAQAMTRAGVIGAGHHFNHAVAINDFGQKLIDASSGGLFSGPAEAYLWNNAGVIGGSLGTPLSSTQVHARDINNSGQVVGGAGTAFLWADGRGMIDLNTVLPVGSGWRLDAAAAINDAGQIVGHGTRGGEYRAFLLTPSSSPPSSAPVNLAPGQQPSQSTTLPGTNGALLAIDNNTNGDWRQGSVTHTGYENQPWWQVDLGASRAISTVELFNRTDSSGGRLANFYVLVSDTPFPSGDLNTLLAQPHIWRFHHGTQAGSPTTISVHRMGRYVRVQLAGAGYLSLAEAKVFGYTASAVPNLALGKTASQSSRPQGTPAPGAAVDGTTDGRWAGGSVTHTDYENRPWWQIDLGASQTITTVNLFNRTDNNQTRLSNIHVFVSDQPFASTDPDATLRQPGVWHGFVAGTVGAPTSLPVHRNGRYLRVQLSDTNFLSLAEVEVLGFPAPAPDINLALNKPATQSSQPQGTPAPGVAVDGNTDGRWASGSVTHTNLDNQPWWQVDLGASGALTRLEIFNRTDNSQERLGDFYVFVSDQPFASADPDATLRQPGVTRIHLTTRAGAPTGVPIHRTGRYVRVQLAGPNYLSLAEVKVLGTP